LSTTIKIRLSEALLGFSRVCLVHLDGRGIRIEVKKGERVIRHDEELVIRGEGMPIRGAGKRGDLYVRFEVEMPGESWASRQDVVGSVCPPYFGPWYVLTVTEYKGGSAGTIARDGPITRDSHHPLLGTSS
jgi:DnaJ-class molecular chaperone